MTLALSVGTRIPAYLTALGRVLLSELSESEFDHYLNTTKLHRETERTITDPARLRDAVGQVREQGYCIMDQEIETGICAVAVPVHPPNRPSMAISVAAHATGTSFSTLEEQHLPALQATAAEMERVFRMRG
jgi:IclR family pca regulon transcriptional regulator